jgi:hypothetical protein
MGSKKWTRQNNRAAISKRKYKYQYKEYGRPDGASMGYTQRGMKGQSGYYQIRSEKMLLLKTRTIVRERLMAAQDWLRIVLTNDTGDR